VSEAPLINTQLIAELAEVLPPEELAATMARFAKELVAKHSVLEGALSNHDCETMCRAAHAMTGTCGTFGAMRLSELCRDLLEKCEDKTAHNPADAACIAQMDKRVTAINTCIDDTLKELETALSEQGS